MGAQSARRIPLYRGQGNEPFNTADARSAAKRGQTVPYDVNGAPTGASGVAADVAFTPAGSVAATDVQTAIEELDAEKLSVAAAAAGYQPLDSDLTAIAALSTTPFGRALLELLDAAAARTALGLGSLATVSDLTGHITSVGAATALGSFTVAHLNTALSDGDVATGGGTAIGTNTGDQTSIVGITGTKAQFDTAVSDGNIVFVGDTIPVGSLSGLGTGVGAALAVNVGSAGAPVLFNGAGGTPSSLTLTNATGLPTAGLLNDAVTFAKIQNIATARVLGRFTSGTGDVEELTTTGTGNVVMSDSPTFTTTFTAPRGVFQNTGANALLITNRTDGKVAVFGAAGSSTTIGYDNAGIFKIESNSRANLEAGNMGTGATTRLEIDASGYVKIPALGDYADDSAAAAGGVPVTGLYRNGSVLMIRVA